MDIVGYHWNLCLKPSNSDSTPSILQKQVCKSKNSIELSTWRLKKNCSDYKKLNDQIGKKTEGSEALF